MTGAIMARLYGLVALCVLGAVIAESSREPLLSVGSPEPVAVSVSGLTPTQHEVAAELARRLDVAELRLDASEDGLLTVWWLLDEQDGCMAPGGAEGERHEWERRDGARWVSGGVAAGQRAVGARGVDRGARLAGLSRGGSASGALGAGATVAPALDRGRAAGRARRGDGARDADLARTVRGGGDADRAPGAAKGGVRP